MQAVLRIGEIIQQFPEEYVLIDRCRFDAGCEITHGRIVHTTSDRDEVYQRLRRTPNSVVVYAGPDAREHEGAFLDEGRAWERS